MKKISLLLLLVVLSGCVAIPVQDTGNQVQRFHINKGNALAEGFPRFETRAHFFLWGLFPANDIDARSACDSRKVSDIVSKRTFGDAFLTVITLGIYNPRTYVIYCKA